ncbi:MAG: hypothetical protein LBQ12_11235 [Deltaproteobacteria bacterium]|nr:hypothetical protein [Deltaproteobacteria bacterium]
MLLNNDGCVLIEMKYCHRRKTAKNSAAGTSQAGKLAKRKPKDKELSSALDAAEEQIRSRDYAGPFRAERWEAICLAVAIRGKTQAAARFVDTDKANGRTGS